MLPLREIEQAILANGRVDGLDLETLRRHLARISAADQYRRLWRNYNGHKHASGTTAYFH